MSHRPRTTNRTAKAALWALTATAITTLAVLIYLLAKNSIS